MVTYIIKRWIFNLQLQHCDGFLWFLSKHLVSHPLSGHSHSLHTYKGFSVSPRNNLVKPFKAFEQLNDVLYKKWFIVLHINHTRRFGHFHDVLYNEWFTVPRINHKQRFEQLSDVLYKGMVNDPPYFKLRSTLCISYNDTWTIESKLFNYKQNTLECLDIEHLKGRYSPPTYSCSSSPFSYSPAGHVITRRTYFTQV